MDPLCIYLLLTTSSRNYTEETGQQDRHYKNPHRKTLAQCYKASKNHGVRAPPLSYLLIADCRVSSTLTIDSHEGIGQTLDSHCNLDKVVERDVAATYYEKP
jgi:hypothetical protein